MSEIEEKGIPRSSESSGWRRGPSRGRTALGLVAGDQRIDLVCGAKLRQGRRPRNRPPTAVRSARRGRMRRYVWMSSPSAAACKARIGPPCETTRVAPSLVSPGDADHGSDHSLGHLLVGLAVVPARDALPPARDSLREALLRLGAGQARPRADVHLAQLRKLGHLEPLRPRDLGGRVGRPLQVARVDRVELDAASNAPRAPAPAGDPSRSTGGRRAPASGERRSSRSPRAARAG